MLGAAFDPAYSIVKKHEGCYVNNPQDPGGETYAGIARNIHPSWSGWAKIDQIKTQNQSSGNTYTPPVISTGNPFSDIGHSIANFFGFGSIDDTERIGWLTIQNPRLLPLSGGMGAIETNTCFPELNQQVEAFYRDQWNRSRAGELASQKVANNYFDLFILSSQAARLLQQAINRVGGNVAEDNRIGPQTISAANRLDENQLNEALVAERKGWHTDRVQAGLSPGVFLEGWLKRASTFGTGIFSNPTTKWVTAGVLILGSVAAWKYYEHTKQKTSGSKKTKRAA